ncbi:hypothetical protein HPP92_018832 [Vanilla planifolia]|uniref:Uncharacterized protein n=1 Tax=Vanilla planifolia TaxID=51239 RepID=A0A835Q4R0_VANPL|nr:hypothetical protein HPP92_018832 [Vanilla planifolia]
MYEADFIKQNLEIIEENNLKSKVDVEELLMSIVKSPFKGLKDLGPRIDRHKNVASYISGNGSLHPLTWTNDASSSHA